MSVLRDIAVGSALLGSAFFVRHHLAGLELDPEGEFDAFDAPPLEDGLEKAFEGERLLLSPIVSGQVTAKVVSDLESELAERHGVHLHLIPPRRYHGEGYPIVELRSIIVPRARRNQGVGCAVMEDLNRWADNNGVELVLTPSTDLGSFPLERLVKFYERQGFVHNSGDDRDPRTRAKMLRLPKTPELDLPLKKSEWRVVRLPLDIGTVQPAYDLIKEHHYAGNASSARIYMHALMPADSDEIVGVAHWIQPGSPAAAKSVNPKYPKLVLVLSRLVVRPDAPKNAASYLLGRAIRDIKKDGRYLSLVTYADTRLCHTGAIYKATNWEYAGLTPPYRVWLDPEGRQVSRRYHDPKTKKRLNYTADEMRARGNTYAGRFPKHKFVMHLGTKPPPPPKKQLELFGPAD